jgi:uncharacterized membrane protein YbhN (UPF0104 family)
MGVDEPDQPDERLSPRPDPIVDEPPQPTRIRRPSDLIRFLGWSTATFLMLLLGDVAIQTTSGLERDISTAATTLPDLLLPVLGAVSGVLLLVLPFVLLLDLALRRSWRLMVDAMLGGALAWVVATIFDHVLITVMTPTLRDALTAVTPSGGHSAAAFPLLAGVVAFTSIAGLTGRPRLTALTLFTVAGFTLFLLIDHRATVLALTASATFGRAVGVGLRYLLGSINTRPPGREVAAALARVAHPLASLRLLDDGADDGRRYEGVTVEGERLDIYVLDRDRRAARLLYQGWRILRVQSRVERRGALSLRRAVDQAAAPVLAATAAGIRTPALRAAASVNADASLLAYHHVDRLRSLDTMADLELTDQLISKAWEQARWLHRAGIAHEDLHLGNFAVDANGDVWLLNLSEGEIAADQLTLRIDDAEMLTATAVRVGIERAIAAALRELTPKRLGEALPLMQPIALSRRTRRDLKSHRGLLSELRTRVIAVSPTASADPIRLERVRPRTVLTFVALAIAVSILLGQIGNVDLVTLVTEARPSWALLALLASLLTYIGATLALTGFAPKGLSPVRTFLAQLAATFVTLVTPASVGGVATNARYLQAAGVAPALALSSVGISQLFVFGSYLLLIVVFGVFTTAQSGAPDLIPGQTVVFAIAAIVVVGLIAMLVPWTRRSLAARVRPLFVSTVPRLLEMLRSPRRLSIGLAGALLLNLAYAAALTASVRAYGGGLSYPTVGFVYLAAGAIAAVAPTPGGIGAVEAALAAGLSTAGLDGTTAVQAALLFRTATFWLPVAPGWVAFSYLQRKGAL